MGDECDQIYNVVVIHNYHNARKNSVNTKEAKQVEDKENRAKQNDKIQKNIRSCFC